jgi:hypothetical protein
MNTFVIDSENNITVFGTGEPVPETAGWEEFKTSEELGHLAESWPTDRLIEIWNTLPGATPVKKFTSRQVAAARIWKAIQNLKGRVAPQAAHVATTQARTRQKATPVKTGTRAKRPAKVAKPVRKTKAAGAREGSKTAKVVALLGRPTGATLKELMKATGWQSHSVRGFISGALGKKLALKVESTKREDGERLYKIAR